MAELAYAHGLGPCPARVRGSNPLGSTQKNSFEFIFPRGLEWEGGRGNGSFTVVEVLKPQGFKAQGVLRAEQFNFLREHTKNFTPLFFFAHERLRAPLSVLYW